MSDQQNNQYNQQDASDRTEEMAQSQQPGYGNQAGLDQQAQDSMGGMTGENDGSDMGQPGTGQGQGQSGQGQSGQGQMGQGQSGQQQQSGVTGGMGGADGMTGSAAGASDDATESLIERRREVPEDGDMTSLQSDMGDGMGSQSGAGAGSSGTGQTT